MRKGVNPEKYKKEELPQFLHRVIVPVYIPNLEEAYYKNQLPVFNAFLENLFLTIDLKVTAVTLIDNNCCLPIKELIKSYLDNIDKYIVYSENKGKVLPVLEEARGVQEKFITITDADVLFYSGWEQAVFEIFNGHPKAGVVAPLPSPSLAFYENTSVFTENYLFGRIGYDKIVQDRDAELYLYGMGNSSLLNRENRPYSWKEKQYFLKKEPKAIVGAGHFVATYKSAMFKGEAKFPVTKFKNGLEKEFIDELCDRRGWYRLSTVNTFAFHMGNNLEENQLYSQPKKDLLMSKKLFKESLVYKKSFIPYRIRTILFKILKKMLNL